MLVASTQFLVAAAVIVAAGVLLTRCADVIAEATGLGRLLVGSLFLAVATSLPEMSVTLSAVRRGYSDLAVGDLLGATLFNLLTLSLIDLLHKSRGRMFSRAAAAHALSATMSISMTALAGLALILSRRWPDATWLGVGLPCWALVVAFVLGMRLVYYDQRLARQQPEAQAAEQELRRMVQAGWRRAALGYAAATVVIVVAGPYVAEAADTLADLTGLGGTFVGTTLVAFSTTLPELVATVAAVRLGAFDLALGNVFGSNAFNIVLLALLDAASPGTLLATVSPAHALTCFGGVLVTAVAILGQLYQAKRRIKFVEPDAVLVLVLVLAILWLLYAAQ